MKHYYYCYNIFYYNEKTKDIEIFYFANWSDLKNSSQYVNDRKIVEL